jgi:hypothetical protein
MEHLAQPTMLLANWSVHPLLHLLPDLLELPYHAFGLRFALDHELAASGLPAVVRKAQKTEGLRTPVTCSRPRRGGEPSELDQPGLALVY